MEKISGIIPKAGRLGIKNNIDGPQRRTEAGAVPSKPMPSSIEASVRAHRERRDWRQKDLAHARMADGIATDFFVRNQIKPDQLSVSEIPMDDPLDPAPKVIGSTKIEPSLEQREAIIEDVGFTEEDLQTGLYPKGSFIDYSA